MPEPPPYLPFLYVRSDIDFVREGAAGLRMQMPIRIRNPIRADFCVWASVLHPFLRSGDVNHPVDDCMRHVYALWTEFLAQTL